MEFVSWLAVFSACLVYGVLAYAFDASFYYQGYPNTLVEFLVLLLLRAFFDSLPILLAMFVYYVKKQLTTR